MLKFCGTYLLLGSPGLVVGRRPTSIHSLKLTSQAEYADFRGQNVTPVIARTFERSVCSFFFCKSRMEGFLITHVVPVGVCINALLMMQHTFLAALDKRDALAVRMFTVDVSKAFDNIKQDI